MSARAMVRLAALGIVFGDLATSPLYTLQTVVQAAGGLFTPESAGKHTLSGQLSFSVCTEDKCMIEKRDLALEIEAK